jgi:hypothetical protein
MRGSPGATGYTRALDGSGRPERVTFLYGEWRADDGSFITAERVFATEAEAVAGRSRRPHRYRVTATTHAARTHKE